MDGMSVDITLTRNSTLLIMFSAEVYITGTGTYCMYWRAMVNDTIAYPDTSWIRIEQTTDPSTHSYIFYSPNVIAGTYTVKILWRMFDSGTTGNVDERTLTVNALPA